MRKFSAELTQGNVDLETMICLLDRFPMHVVPLGKDGVKVTRLHNFILKLPTLFPRSSEPLLEDSPEYVICKFFAALRKGVDWEFLSLYFGSFHGRRSYVIGIEERLWILQYQLNEELGLGLDDPEVMETEEFIGTFYRIINP